MRIHRSLDGFDKPRKAVVTSGTFDGVHLGHRKILARLLEIARQTGGETVVITYWPHPRLVLFPHQKGLRLINTLEEKARLLEAIGIDRLLVIPFDEEFSQTTSKDYIQNILVDAIGTDRLVIGYDHRFGRNREGGFDYLKAHDREFGFTVEEIPKQEVDEVAVSSTKIRKALAEGRVEEANAFLGSRFTLEGTVVKGQQVGRTIGFPTANLEIGYPYKLVPADGIYAVRVRHGESVYGGMLNVGLRPTLAEGLERTIEANLFGFDGDLYGETLRLEFVSFLREERKFDSLDELKEWIGKDKEAAEKALREAS